MSNRYLVVTPARDEEVTIEFTIRSMIAQRIRPVRWVIVNDGSTDRTGQIVSRYLPHHAWIELLDLPDRGFRALGGGVVRAFQVGLARASSVEWDFVVKLDADLSFGPDYFANLLEAFAANPQLGMASGKTFLLGAGGKRIEWCHDEHVRGPAKMYSRACFEAIGGLEPVRGWDMIDETRAQMNGFETRSFLKEELIHHRPIDARQERILASRFEMGRLYYQHGYHWLYQVVRSLRSAWQDPPRGLGGAALLAGYLWAAATRAERRDAEYVAFVRRRQRARFTWRHLAGYLRATRRAGS